MDSKAAPVLEPFIPFPSVRSGGPGGGGHKDPFFKIILVVLIILGITIALNIT